MSGGIKKKCEGQNHPGNLTQKERERKPFQSKLILTFSSANNQLYVRSLPRWCSNGLHSQKFSQLLDYCKAMYVTSCHGCQKVWISRSTVRQWSPGLMIPGSERAQQSSDTSKAVDAPTWPPVVVLIAATGCQLSPTKLTGVLGPQDCHMVY